MGRLGIAPDVFQQQGLSARVVAAFYRGLEAQTTRGIERRFLERARVHAGRGDVAQLLPPDVRYSGEQRSDKAPGRADKAEKEGSHGLGQDTRSRRLGPRHFWNRGFHTDTCCSGGRSLPWQRTAERRSLVPLGQSPSAATASFQYGRTSIVRRNSFARSARLFLTSSNRLA